MSRFSKVNDLISRGSDFFVAGAVLMIVMLLVIRVDQSVMDWLIAINISISALVLLTVLYIPDPRRVPSFPTLLLLTTLFRLGLNVSTTRLILLEADAGDIIEAFGNFVVAGNFVVGAVIFLVLVIIQFVVIAQGAERVATVSARFTLDSLPGKQGVIEQDLAAGRISEETGRRQREALDRESKLYGAMDGAMKFVKGDAIAGIIISLVNVVAGLVVGVMQQDMDVGEAAQLYTLLTVGDGLVSQIPALLLSVSAGLVVTRVAAEMDDGKGGRATNIGRDIVEQILSQKRALLLLTILLLLVATTSVLFNTGFPLIPFLALTAVAGSLYFVRRKMPDDVDPLDMDDADEDDEEPRSDALLTSVSLSGNLYDSIAAELTAEKLTDAYNAEASKVGLPLEKVALRRDNTLEGNWYTLRAAGRVIGRGRANPDLGVGLVHPADPRVGRLPHEPLLVPWEPKGTQAIQFNVAQNDAARSAGIEPRSATDMVLLHLRAMVRHRPERFLGADQAFRTQTRIAKERASLATSLSTSGLLSRFRPIMHDLLVHKVPLIDPALVAETIILNVAAQRVDDQLIAGVRSDLGGYVVDRVASGSGKVAAYEMAYEAESQLMQQTLNAPPRRAARIVAEHIGKTAPPHPDPDQFTVICCSATNRHHLQQHLADQRPDIVVISNEELDATQNLDVIGPILADEDGM